MSDVWFPRPHHTHTQNESILFFIEMVLVSVHITLTERLIEIRRTDCFWFVVQGIWSIIVSWGQRHGGWWLWWRENMAGMVVSAVRKQTQPVSGTGYNLYSFSPVTCHPLLDHCPWFHNALKASSNWGPSISDEWDLRDISHPNHNQNTAVA